MPEKLPFRDMEGEDLATTVLTCEGDIRDPTFPFKLQHLVNKLQNLISDEENPIKVTKVEPWNSVRVTFNIPLEAAQRLRQLAERGDRVLRDLGILSVQIEGDQVITLTLASQYSEPQEIVLRKASDEQGDVASLSFNLPNSDSVPGPSSAEPAHKNISQFLGHIVGGASSATVAVGSAARVEKIASPKPETSVSFRSPNVIAPSSTEPIPFPPAAAAAATTTTAPVPSSSRVAPNISLKPPTGFGPFPFASMTHAMNTKNSATSPQYQPVLHVQGGNPRISFTSSAAQASSTIRNTTTCNAITATSVSPKVTSPTLQKVSRTLANSAFNNLVTRAVTTSAMPQTSRANVALSSPLLVNLLQSETSNLQQHNKLMPPPSQASNQAPKRKRKPRKPKEKVSEEGATLSPSYPASPSSPSFQSHVGVRSPSGFDPLNVLNQPLNVPLNNLSISSSSTQIANMHPMPHGQPPVSTVKPQMPNIHPQAQGLPAVSLQSQSVLTANRQIGHQTLSAFRPRAVPNIHPQAQGQPQVHTGNLPLHTHIPVGAPPVARPPGTLPSYGISTARGMPMTTTRPLFRDTSSLMKIIEKSSTDAGMPKSDKSSAPSTPSTSTPDSNPFPSPPSSTDGKTKHLINPFTGQLEPMPSDDEEEESIGSLPPFPDFENDTSEKSHSERSLSDGGKDTNLSSDTDSGISKSITDVSQSSTDCSNVESGKEMKKIESPTKADSVPSASVTSSVPGEKLKLRLKIDPKTIRESKESEMKEKRMKDVNPQTNQKVDMTVVNTPGVKKNTPVVSTPTTPEPRVPPLHISLRGPNAAVVVSPRKDEKAKHAVCKEDHLVTDSSPKLNPKKARSPRSARIAELTASALTSRAVEPVDRKIRGSNMRDFKKGKDEIWNQNVKNMSMSGGGIVEMSEKISSHHLAYETYLAGASVATQSVQNKSNILALSTGDAYKSEMMTLTSCATGESVTLHSFSGSKSPLPLQISGVSEAETLPTTVNVQTVQNNIRSIVPISASPLERTESAVLDTIVNTVQEKAFSDVHVDARDNSLTNSRNTSLMQNNHLPHSPTAPVDSKSDVQKENTSPSDQVQPQSASSVNIESTVPLSSCDSASPTCNVKETASESSVQMQVSDTTDANRLSAPERSSSSDKSAENISSSTDCLIKTNHQCNTDPSATTDATGAVNIRNNPVDVNRNVQSNTLAIKVESINTKEFIDEVQNDTDVNTNYTANNTDSVSVTEPKLTNSIDAKSETVQISTPNTASDESKSNQLTFSNHMNSCDLPAVSCLAPPPKKEIISEAISTTFEKGVCLVETKAPPIAQIISVDNSPIQSHVIEVPSLPASPAVPTKVLAKSGHAVPMTTVTEVASSLIASCGSAYLPSRNILVMPQDVGHVMSITSSMVSPDSRIVTASVSAPPTSNPNFSVLSLPAERQMNHFDAVMEEAPSNAKDSPAQSSSAAPSEESSMDSIDEERKRCVQLSEVPTSTPGPPQTDPSADPLDSHTTNMDVGESDLSTSVNETESLEKALNESENTSEASSDITETKLPTPSAISNSLSSCESVQTSENHVQFSISNSTSSCDDNTPDSKIHNQSSEPTLPIGQFLIPIQKDDQQDSPVPVTSVCSEASTLPRLISLEDAGSSFTIEHKSLPLKADIKKDSPTETFQIVGTSSPVVTSLLSPVKYLPSELSNQKFKLILKGSNPRSALQNNNSPLVVPLNSSKTVPIKLVTLPSGTSALSVRSTSNPNIVEIIGPKSTSQNSPSANNPHPSSPVRLVVSKMSPGLSAASPSGSSSMLNRVVVKSVVVTGTSPSIKLVSANTVCTATTPVSSSSRATSTSSAGQSVTSSTTLNPTLLLGHNPKLPVEEELKPSSDETSTMQSSSVSCVADQRVNIESINSESSDSLSISTLASPPPSVSMCSTADSTSDIVASDCLSRVQANADSLSKVQTQADSTFAVKDSPDTTFSNPNPDELTYPKENSCTSTNTNSLTSLNLTNSLLLPSPNVIANNSENDNSLSSHENSVSEVTSVADTTTEVVTGNPTLSIQTNNPESHKENVVECKNVTDIVDSQEKDISTDNTGCQNAASELCTIKKELSKPEDSIDNEQTTNSAITTSSDHISNKVESSDAAHCNSIENSQNYCTSESPEFKVESASISAEPALAHCIDASDVALDAPCIIENEVVIESNAETPEASECLEIPNTPYECENILLESSFTAKELGKNAIVKPDVTVIPESKCSVDLHDIRPLGEDSIDIVDSIESEEAKVVVEDSQLEISLVYSKPLKRKCSENAAELIKACMGVEDSPKRGAVLKPKSGVEEEVEKETEKIEENVRMSLRIRRDDSTVKKAKGAGLHSDCSTDEEITLSELVSKSRTRDKLRGRVSNKDNPAELNNCRPGRRRSGSNESRHSEEIRTRTPRETKREASKKEEGIKKLPERTKRGSFKAQDQVIVSKVGLQRSSRIREQETKPNALNNSREESNSIVAKRKTRGATETQEMVVQMKRRRYSKDGHR